MAQYSAAIPGAAEQLRALRQRGLKIGSCSGYPASVMRRVIERAATEGLEPECIVASDEVPRASRAGHGPEERDRAGPVRRGRLRQGRRHRPGIEEGRRAGMWTVGLLLSGNAAGLTLEEYLSLDEAGRDAARARADAELSGAAPHYLIDTVADLPAVISDIERRLAAGQRP